MVLFMGTSSWLSALPLAEHGFVLHKSVFTMPWHYNMVGHLVELLQTVLVGLISWLIIPYLVPKALSLL